MLNHEKQLEVDKAGNLDQTYEVTDKLIDEAGYFLGDNPDQVTDGINVREDVVKRIKIWIKSGVGKKEDREKLIASVPRKGQINLEAPWLNEEIVVDLHPKALARNEHFREYQNLAGSALAALSSV